MTSDSFYVDLTKARYDQGTYIGRLKHFSEITDPRNLLASEGSLQSARKLIAQHNPSLPVTQQQAEALYASKKLVDSTLHPDTQEKIFLPFRMACFVPTNTVIVAGMLLSRPTLFNIIAWQTINQSVNVAFNYANANKTTKMDFNETALAYATAVASSCTIAVGMNEWVKRLKGVSPSTLSLLNKCVPFTAVAAAGTINVFLMRQKELTDGIAVMDDEGNVVGKSTKAGWTAISQVAISRIATAFPAVFLPGIVMSQLERTVLMQKFPGLAMPVNLLTISGSLLAALPCAIALFPQKASVEAKQLESKFWDLKKSNGDKINTLYFNRGL